MRMQPVLSPERRLQPNARKVERIIKEVAAGTRKAGEYRVDGHPGLVLVIQPSGTATWYFFYNTQEGQTRRLRKLKLGRFTDLTLGQAADRVATKRAEVNGGSDPAKSRNELRKSITFKELAEERFTKGNALEASTEASYRGYLERDAYSAFGALPAIEVTPHHVLDVVDRIEARGSARSADMTKAAVSSVFTYGIQRRIIAENPCAGLKRRGDYTPRRRVWSNDEIRRFWLCIDHAPVTQTMKTIVRLAILLGQRRSEIAGARRSELEDLDTTTPRWVIPGDRKVAGQLIRGRTKNDQEQIVPLPPAAANLFREAVRSASDSEYVFPSRVGRTKLGHIRPDAVTKAMARIREAFSFQDMTIHDTRRLITTTLVDEYDIPDRVLDRILNHIKTDVTGRYYNHAKLERQMRDALGLWESWLSKLVEVDEDLIEG